MPETATKTVIRQAQGLENDSKGNFTSKGDVSYVPLDHQITWVCCSSLSI